MAALIDPENASPMARITPAEVERLTIVVTMATPTIAAATLAILSPVMVFARFVCW